jgi:hypothetical protein
MVKERLKRYFKLDENRLSTVHKFVEVPKQPDSAESVWMLSHALNLPSNCFIIGVNGMFDGRISSDLILALAAMLCQQNRDIHIVWTNAETNGPTYEILDNDLRRAGISSQVHLIPQQVDADAYYALFDIFLLLSKEDTLPLLAIEVGLRGVPVICFENTAIATDYLTPGIGKAVPYLDITALHRTVLEYYTNKAQLKKEALSVVNAVKSRFLISIQAPKLYEIVNHYYNEQELVPVDEHPAITVITHLFYDTTWKEIKHKLVFFKDLNTRFLFSVSEACLIKDELVADIKGSFKDAHVLTTTNIGKDIGGKFALIDLYLTLGIQSDYIIFVHDKVSPHSIDGHSWKNNLQKIIDYKNYWQILAVFKQDDKIGVVGAIEHLINEYDRTNGTFINNSDRTHEFLKKYNITISNYDFIGGTMYWMKAPIIEKFFTKYHPLQIRSELEAGNVMDNHGSTNAHTWERVLSWIATNQGYKVYGI